MSYTDPTSTDSLGLPLFVVNLPRDTMKKEMMRKRCASLGLTPRFIEATEGASISKQIPALTPGELGCANSHRRIFGMIVEEQISWSVIVEDDILFEKDFIRVVHRIEKISDDYEIVLLGHHSCNSRKLPTAFAFRCTLPLTENYCLAHPIENGCGTYGYMISLEGATNLLKKMEKIEKPVDHYTGDYRDVSLRIVHPPIITIDESLEPRSTIEQERRERKFSRHRWKEKVLQYRVFSGLYRCYQVLRAFVRGWVAKCPMKELS